MAGTIVFGTSPLITLLIFSAKQALHKNKNTLLHIAVFHKRKQDEEVIVCNTENTIVACLYFTVQVLFNEHTMECCCGWTEVCIRIFFFLFEKEATKHKNVKDI